MKLGQLVSLMEKVGSINFDTTTEKEAFVKIAQGVPMDPATMQMMAQQAGMAPMTDPGMIDPAMAGADPAMMAQPQLPTTGSEETVVGESITNSDIESLLKVINIVTSLKTKYDVMKKEQMDLLKAQSEGGAAGPAPGPAPTAQA